MFLWATDTAAASPGVHTSGAGDRFEKHEPAAASIFGWYGQGYALSSDFAVHVKKKSRFRAPESVKSQERSSDLQPATHFNLLVSINSHYYKANFSSQQYGFLFRLTPF